jgi:hypothetical protein
MATIVGLFDTTADAQAAVQELVDSGVQGQAISMIAGDVRGEYAQAVGDASADAATGALRGGVLGGVLGVLVGIGALAIPGIGPVIAAGPLAAALGSAGAGALVGAGAGAVGGGLLGALLSAGVPEQQAHVYAEGVRRGGALVSVAVDAELEPSVHAILQRYHAVDIDARADEWRQSGWTRFDADTGPAVRTAQEADTLDTAGGPDSPADGSVAPSIGALSGGMIPGGYGAAGDTILGLDDEADRNRRH